MGLFSKLIKSFSGGAEIITEVPTVVKHVSELEHTAKDETLEELILALEELKEIDQDVLPDSPFDSILLKEINSCFSSYGMFLTSVEYITGGAKYVIENKDDLDFYFDQRGHLLSGRVEKTIRLYNFVSDSGDIDNLKHVVQSLINELDLFVTSYAQLINHPEIDSVVKGYFIRVTSRFVEETTLLIRTIMKVKAYEEKI